MEVKFVNSIKILEENRKMYNLDKTCIKTRHTKSHLWVDEIVKYFRKTFLSGLSTDSKNLTITINIGSETVFIEGGQWMF